MFNSLAQNLSKIFDRITRSGILSEEQINDTMRDVRIALLEADVALPVVKDLIDEIKVKATGQEIIKSVSPGQMVIKIIHQELINILDSTNEESSLNLKAEPPINILMLGLQGSGKTTASAKLALKLKNQNKKLLLVSLDTYRPEAQEQLAILAKSIGVDSLPIIKSESPIDIVHRAMSESRLLAYDIVIYDTAGRMQIDGQMMKEALNIKTLTKPTETILVVDAMTGQAAVDIASNFDQKLSITGVIMSRIDGDSKGGAALSIKHATKKPIKFLSTGEKLTDFELFDAKRIASRILDMGDIISFVEKASNLIDIKDAEKAAAKMRKGKFDLQDYLSQLYSIKKLGGIESILGMVPGVNKMIAKASPSKMDDRLIARQIAIILSMTPKERRYSDILNASRRKRIASGSGVSVHEVNKLLKQFQQISSMMKRASNMDPKALMRSGLGGLLGNKN